MIGEIEAVACQFSFSKNAMAYLAEEQGYREYSETLAP